MTEPAEPAPLNPQTLPFVKSIAKALAAKGVRPQQVTLLGIGFALVGFGGLYAGGRYYSFHVLWLGIGLVGVLGRLLCNALDGMMEVEGTPKPKGSALYSETANRIEDALLFMGAGYVAYSAAGAWCAAAALFTAFVRVYGASLGQAHDFGGPLAKLERMILLGVGLIGDMLFPRHWGVLGFVLWAILAGTALTATLRLQRIYQKAP